MNAASHLWAAVQIVAIADIVMSLDNVIAVAAAANGSIPLLVLGLAISVPLIVAGAALIMKRRAERAFQHELCSSSRARAAAELRPDRLLAIIAWPTLLALLASFCSEVKTGTRMGPAFTPGQSIAVS